MHDHSCRFTRIAFLPALAFGLLPVDCSAVAEEPALTTPTAYIYAASLATVRIDPVTGVPTPVAAPAVPSFSGQVAATSSGARLYLLTQPTSSQGPPEALAYAIDPATGALGAQPFSRASVPVRSFALAIAPGGRMLTTFEWLQDPVLAPCEGPGQAHVFALSPKGAFIPRGTARTGVASVRASFTPYQGTLYVANRGDDHSLWGPCPGGSLDRYTVDPVTASLPPQPTESLEDYHAHTVAVTPDGRQVLALTPLGLVQFDVAPDGHLSERTRLAVTWSSRQPLGLTISPDGRRVYLALGEEPYVDNAYKLLTFALTGDGLAPVGTPQSVDVATHAVHVTPDGRFVYVGSATEWAVFDASGAGAPQPIAGSPFRFKSRGFGDLSTVLVAPR